MASGVSVQHRGARRLSVLGRHSQDGLASARSGARTSGSHRSLESPDHGQDRAARRQSAGAGLATRGANMVSHYVDGDAAADLLQRRWFAAFKAASGVRAECEALLESIALTEAAWRPPARVRLSQPEALRDALGEELDILGPREGPVAAESRNRVMTAA